MKHGSDQSNSTSSSSAKKSNGSYAYSSTSQHSGSGSGSSNPFRSHVRENLPSFSECFAGFHRTAHLGEHHIVAASPQQMWSGSSSARASKSGNNNNNSPMGYGSRNQHSSSGGAPPTPVTLLSPFRVTPTRSSPNRMHAAEGISGGDMPAPVTQQSAQDFSYKTLDLSEDDESASDPLGTPPRQIERVDSDEEDTTGGKASSGGRARSDGNQDNQHTPIHKPPLHPNVSPIFSPIQRMDNGNDQQQHGYSPLQQQHNRPSAYAIQSNHSSPQRDTMHRAPSAFHSEELPLRSSTPSEAAQPRRPRTLEELALKHLFPLFGEFLRSLPPKQLEECLLREGVDAGGYQHYDDDASFHAHRSDPYAPMKSVKELHKMIRSSYRQDDHWRSVSDRVDQIIPPYDGALLSDPSCSRLMTYSRRDFAYHHPYLSDYSSTISAHAFTAASSMPSRYTAGINRSAWI